jgi:cytosine/adenosine deaminase-related metal-dependent hydrolase
MLEGRLTCAHGVWLDGAGMEMLARHDVTVSHNPASNLMLGSGVLRFGACAACGLRLGLGSDSANTGGRADLFAMMRLAMMLPRRDDGNFGTWPGADAVFAAATENGAAALGLKGRVGRIAEGQLADLVLVRAATAAGLAATPGLDVLVQHAGPEHVAAVMVGGEWVMRDGRILAFDETAMLAEAGEQARAVRARVANRMPVLMGAMPAMAARFLRVCG